MASVRHHIRIAASPDAVWKVVSDSAALPDWFGPVATSVATPGGRVVTLVDGPEVAEDIVTNDDELRRFQYAIKSGLPVEHHLGTFDVIEDGAGSLVVYSADVLPDEMGPMFSAVMGEGIKGLKEYCESRG
jgi:hypothetical protein